jgi:4-hydroxy-tetrahydrodipicolinate synthase
MAKARETNAALMESFEFINSEASVFSMSIKAMLRTLGQEVGECRLPLPPTPPEVGQRARQVWAGLNG